MKAKHVLLAGSSGGGKTTKGREMHARHDGISVWVNHNETERVAGKRCRGLKAMQSAVRACSSVEEVRNLRLNLRCDDARDGAETARQFARGVGEYFDAEVCTQVITDEVHSGLPDDENESAVSTGNPHAGMLHEDRDLNVKWVGMTQDPTELYYPPIKNVKHIVWCGEVKTFHEGFLRFYNLDDLVAGDGVDDESLPRQDFEYVVIKPTRPPKAVHRGETKEKYG